jgi:predicted transcriptional regulator
MAQSIGDRELALVQHLADHPSSTVGEVSEGFGARHGLARSTVLTMMERLRRKGHLARQLVDGTYRYSVEVPAGQVVRGVVRQFVQRTLQGSVSPVVAYLSEEAEVSDADFAELQELVARLQAEREEGGR